jgi:predicted nucleic acid-binding protein
VPERLFLDANVLFTATITPDGVSRTLFELARIDACFPLTSSFALDEARRNVRAKYPAHMQTLEALAEQIELVAEAEAALVAWAADLLPLKDAPILAAAVAARADVLVTGDRRHFGVLFEKTLDGVTILPPRQALEQVLAR